MSAEKGCFLSFQQQDEVSVKGRLALRDMITLQGYWQMLLAEHFGLVTRLHRGRKELRELDFSCELQNQSPHLG